MPVNKADEYRHNNPDSAFVDSRFVRGGRRVVADREELYGLVIKADQLLENVTIVRVLSDGENGGGVTEVVLVDAANIGSPAGWQLYTAGGGSPGGGGSAASYGEYSILLQKDGPQTLSLPAGALALDGQPSWYQADTGQSPTLGNYSFANGALEILAGSDVKAGDKIFGRYIYGGDPGTGNPGSGYTDQQAIEANRQPIADAVANAPVSPDQQDAIDAAKGAAVTEAVSAVQQNLQVPLDTADFKQDASTGIYSISYAALAQHLVNDPDALASLKAAINSSGGGGGTSPSVTRFSSIQNNDGANYPLTYNAAASPAPAYFQGTTGIGPESGGNTGLLNLKLPANTDGFIEFQYYAADGIYSHIGFNTDGGLNQSRNLLKAGIYVEDGGRIGTIDNGVLTLSSSTIPLGGRLRVGRVGSAFKTWVVSADRTTVTDFLTLGYTSTALEFVGLAISDNKKMYDALGGNLVTL